MSRGVGELNPKPLNHSVCGEHRGSGSGSRGRGCFCIEDFLHFSAGPRVRVLGPTTDAGLNVSVLGGIHFSTLLGWEGIAFSISVFHGALWWSYLQPKAVNLPPFPDSLSNL